MYEIKNEKQKNLPDLLVLSIQALGTDPFAELVEVCKPITYGMTKRFFLPAYEREDFLQEGRSVLIKSVYDWKIEKGMPFLQYYQMQLLNHLNMLVRKNYAQKRRVNLEATSLDSLIEETGIHLQGVAPSTTQPEEMMLMQETLDQYIVDLSPLELEVFDLYLSGKLPKEIGKKLAQPEATIRNAIYRCRLKLANLINK